MIISVMVREDLSARCVSNSRRRFATWTASEVGTLVKSDTTSKDTKGSSRATSWVAIKVENCLELWMVDSV